MNKIKRIKFTGVTILLPAMDETYSIEKTIDIILETVNKDDITEFIFLLSDKSDEKTRKTIETIITENSDLKMYIHEQRMPYVGGAIREGIQLATGSHLVMMSTDLETDPYLVQTFIAYSKMNPEKIITASRWRVGGGFSGYDKIKLICNAIFEKMIALLFFSRLSDITYGYRLFPSSIMKSIRWEELKHPFFLETALKPIRLDVGFVEIPAYWEARTEGKSNNIFWENFRYFKTAVHIRFMRKYDIVK